MAVSRVVPSGITASEIVAAGNAAGWAAASTQGAFLVTAASPNIFYSADVSFSPGAYSVSCVNTTVTTVEFLYESGSSVSVSTISGQNTISLTSNVVSILYSTNTGSNINISIQKTGANLSTEPSPTIDVITTTSTYNQTGLVKVLVIGGGAAGSSGGRRVVPSYTPFLVASGGSGGGSGRASISNYFKITSPTPIIIGSGGSGSPGAAGGATSFGNILNASGGGPGGPGGSYGGSGGDGASEGNRAGAGGVGGGTPVPSGGTGPIGNQFVTQGAGGSGGQLSPNSVVLAAGGGGIYAGGGGGYAAYGGGGTPNQFPGLAGGGGGGGLPGNSATENQTGYGNGGPGGVYVLRWPI